MSYDNVLLHDQFADLRTGPLVEKNDGPYREMHARPAHPEDNMGAWQCKVGHWTLPKVLWECVDTPAGRRLRSLATADVYDNILIAQGDPDWQDLQVEAAFTLLAKGEGWGGPVGLLFRFLDSTRFYAAIVDRDGQAKLLKRIVANNWDVLAAAPVNVTEDEPFNIIAEADGPMLRATIAGVRIEAEDAEYKQGLVGFIGAQPVDAGALSVRCTPTEQQRLTSVKRAHAAVLTGKRERAGQPRLWKKIDTQGFGSARRIRLGDLTGDGRLDFLFTRHHPDRDPGLQSLTAVDADGKVLWKRGTPPPIPAVEKSADAPCQIHDIDGDGRNEVVCVLNHEILVLDGQTGETKYAAAAPKPTPLPGVYKDVINHWGGGYDDEHEFVPACALTFADLTGQGARRDLIYSGHYHQTIALDSQLKELWRHANVRGHFPIPYRPKGEQKDHVLCGFHRLDAKGNLVSRVCLTDHQDAIYAGPLDENGTGPDVVLMAAGEDGLLTLTPDYDVAWRVMGHVQRLGIGAFRVDVPGQCVATVLFHRNRGIISLYDSTIKHLWTRDFPVVGATLQPVLFDDSGVEYILYSGIRPAQGDQGGLLDGQGDLVVTLPDDGGPGLCVLAQDMDGDGLDELLLWDHDRMWIYHSDAEVDQDRLLKRERPPLYNSSNFQAYWSRPKVLG